MRSRIDLQNRLESIAGKGHVFFQPPSDTKLEYPCIVYSRSSFDYEHADDRPYHVKTRYDITVIDKHPDSKLFNGVNDLPGISYGQHLVYDNLIHDIFSIYI